MSISFPSKFSEHLLSYDKYFKIEITFDDNTFSPIVKVENLLTKYKLEFKLSRIEIEDYNFGTTSSRIEQMFNTLNKYTRDNKIDEVLNRND